MIGQYLPNNNEKCYSVILPNFSELNRPLACLRRQMIRSKAIALQISQEFKPLSTSFSPSCTKTSTVRTKSKPIQFRHRSPPNSTAFSFSFKARMLQLTSSVVARAVLFFMFHARRNGPWKNLTLMRHNIFLSFCYCVFFPIKLN
jgi:hypothetical protein